MIFGQHTIHGPRARYACVRNCFFFALSKISKTVLASRNRRRNWRLFYVRWSLDWVWFRCSWLFHLNIFWQIILLDGSWLFRRCMPFFILPTIHKQLSCFWLLASTLLVRLTLLAFFGLLYLFRIFLYYQIVLHCRHVDQCLTGRAYVVLDYLRSGESPPAIWVRTAVFLLFASYVFVCQLQRLAPFLY